MHIVDSSAEWVLVTEYAEGAPEVMYAVECLTCPAVSGWVDNEATQVRVWAIEHAARTHHHQFLTTTQAHARVQRVPSSGCRQNATKKHVLSPKTECSAPSPPSSGPRERVTGCAANSAGPAVIVALIVVAGLCGYLIGSTTTS